MVAKVTKLKMFLMGLWPLMTAVAIISLEWEAGMGAAAFVRENAVFLTALASLTYSAFARWKLARLMRGAREMTFEVAAARDEDSGYMLLLFVYVAPFISFDIGSPQGFLGACALLSAAAMVSSHSNSLISNPIMPLLGLRAYRVSGNFESGRVEDIIIVSAVPLHAPTKASYVRVGGIKFITRAVGESPREPLNKSRFGMQREARLSERRDIPGR